MISFKEYNYRPVSSIVVRIVIVSFCLLLFSGCGALTGLPGHGGGKRFAVEQELVATTTRATIRLLDLTTIKGKKVNLFINAIGDAGSGNLIGGRFSIVSQLRGNYIQSPTVTEKSHYPRYTSTSTSAATTTTATTTGLDSSLTTSDTLEVSSTNTLLTSPDLKETQEKGDGMEIEVGAEYKGLGSYHNSEEISSDDLQYLTGLFQTYLFLQGIYVVPPSEAEIDLYITVDVFGTVRTRVDWFLANNEILRAKSIFEVMAVDHASGKLVMEPQAVGTEAEYNEQYIFWIGPVVIKKLLRVAGPLLSNFSENSSEMDLSVRQELDGRIPYPFRNQIEKWTEDDE